MMFVNKCDRDGRYKVGTLIMTLPKKDENGALSVNGRCGMMCVNKCDRDVRHKVGTLIMTLPKKDENGALSVNGR
jgi:hypothetical protein